jgi:hypothetical protein
MIFDQVLYFILGGVLLKLLKMEWQGSCHHYQKCVREGKYALRDYRNHVSLYKNPSTLILS